MAHAPCGQWVLWFLCKNRILNSMERWQSIYDSIYLYLSICSCGMGIYPKEESSWVAAEEVIFPAIRYM